MNYFDKIVQRIQEELPDCDLMLSRYYALLVLVKGAATQLADVHDAWSAWRTETKPDHASLIPFDDLSYDVQQLDKKYRDAIRKVALELA